MTTQHGKNEPKISVIIPVFNGEKYLEEALEGVLAQTYRNFEIILVDDGSNDNTAKIAKRFSKYVQYHSQPNKGPSAARNKAVTLSHGKYLAFLDADDLMESDRLEKQLHAFEKMPELDIAFGHVDEFFSPELNASELELTYEPKTNAAGCLVGTMFVKRDSFARVGYLNEQLRVADFMDWYGKAQDLGLKMHMLPNIVLKRRIHESNYSKQQKKARKNEYTRVLKTALDRRKKGGSSAR